MEPLTCNCTLIVSQGTITSCEKVDAQAEDKALYLADGAFRTLMTINQTI